MSARWLARAQLLAMAGRPIRESRRRAGRSCDGGGIGVPDQVDYFWRGGVLVWAPTWSESLCRASCRSRDGGGILGASADVDGFWRGEIARMVRASP